MKIINIVGARPNFMKIAPIIEALNQYPDHFDHLLVHTGQHYDEKMSSDFFEDLGMPKPDLDLGVGSGSHAEQTARIMVEFEKVCLNEKPDLVIVVGDVNSTMACTITAKKLGIKVAHVEAGLRSRDMTMPEEINRLCTDVLCDYLFTTDKLANENLLREGVAEEKIYFVGNVMIDTLIKHRQLAEGLTLLDDMGLSKGEYATMTLHRPSNVDDPETFMGILEALKTISQSSGVVPSLWFPSSMDSAAFIMSSFLFPIRLFVPSVQVIGLSVFLRIVIHGIPKTVVSSCNPPLSVSTKRACIFK